MMGFSVVATVLTLPHLLMSFFGDSLTRAEMDPLRLLTFAAGNHRRGFRQKAGACLQNVVVQATTAHRQILGVFFNASLSLIFAEVHAMVAC